MRKDSSDLTEPVQREQRWPAVLAVLAVAALYLVVPEHLTVGPNWLLAVLVCALLIPTMITRQIGRESVSYVFGLILSSTVTMALIFSLASLITALIEKQMLPFELLRAAAALWVSNILVFASWYWRLDAGGPHRRELRSTHTEGAFLFPQMTLPSELRRAHVRWKPGFVDYLFLAFNTSTAFSPTDVPVLSRWAKGLMMVQSSISLCNVAILAARAVNIL